MDITEFLTVVAAQEALEAAHATAKADFEAAGVLVAADIATEQAALSAVQATFVAARSAAWTARAYLELNNARDVAETAVREGQAALAVALANYSTP